MNTEEMKKILKKNLEKVNNMSVKEYTLYKK